MDGENNSYLNDSVKFKTLYLLHGSYGGYNDWPLNTNITTYIEKYNLAVVMPDGENSGYNNTSSGDFLKYISKELPNYLEIMFPLYSSKENRFIAGTFYGEAMVLPILLLKILLYFLFVLCYQDVLIFIKYYMAILVMQIKCQIIIRGNLIHILRKDVIYIQQWN